MHPIVGLPQNHRSTMGTLPQHRTIENLLSELTNFTPQQMRICVHFDLKHVCFNKENVRGHRDHFSGRNGYGNHRIHLRGGRFRSFHRRIDR
jgi:hypothetical protein